MTHKTDAQQKKKPDGNRAKSKRLNPEDRRQEIIGNAIHVFAQHGFDASTRELAKRLKVSQALLYRYFPSKDALIQQIYQTVYVDNWQIRWDDLLKDRNHSVRQRLRAFYGEYVDVIMKPNWIRIYFFSALNGLKINELYLKIVEERILMVIIEELRDELGVSTGVVTGKDLEMAWVLQSTIFYAGVRLHVYNAPLHLEHGDIIDGAIDMFLSGYQAQLGAH